MRQKSSEEGLIKIVSARANYTYIYQTTSDINDIKFEFEQNKMEEIVCLFLPHHMSESGTTFEDELDSSKMRKYKLDANCNVNETDPFMIEETNFIKSENLTIKSELMLQRKLHNYSGKYDWTVLCFFLILFVLCLD
ncbi:uncharacterized protein LOC142334027 [Lycorma delicatula]|uniref:uncharacterized protein LOC142334027 n=1 Tax=Lycorma delicatula TaxID=130591 RepID=UPI003F51746C